MTELPETGGSARGRDWIDRASAAVSEVIGLLPPDPDDAVLADAERTIAMTFAQGYWMLFHGLAEYPEWLPFIGFLYPSGAINPDTTYDVCRIDPAGTYRISGDRGTVHLLDFQLSEGLPGLREHSGARTGGFNTDDLTFDDMGQFDVVLSRERPAAHTGDWQRLPEGTGSILMRQVRYDWATERGARVAIERLDLPPRQIAPDLATVRARIDAIPDYVRRYQRQFMGYKRQVRDLGPPNVLHHRVRKEKGGAGEGGGMASQVIYHGNFSLATDECLLIETDLPRTCAYWNIQITDELHCAIDAMRCQSSLNGFQATLDDDGRFRAVICAVDPGVPNWLDTAGRPRGGIMGRWTYADSAPIPSTEVVKIAALRDRLPAATPAVSPEERDQALRARLRAAQWRGRH